MFENSEVLLLKDVDYDALGFKAGLEIHRRMKGLKLFCSCRGDVNLFDSSKEIARFRRLLHLSKSEEGMLDPAAVEEIKKGKFNEYVVYDDFCCLVEMDEEPPHDPNMDAVKNALLTCKMFNAYIPNELIFMRKIVVDGSNTSGFQRTALIGLDGYVNTSRGKVGIATICLEEESAHIADKTPDHNVYDLRRLGIPLIEISTTPDLKDAEHVEETAKRIGEMLRFTGFYQRGLGSIRQDINISIRDGYRVEIKGVQDLDMIKDVVEKEVLRQKSLLTLRKMLESFDFRVGKLIEVSKYFGNVKSKLFKNKRVYAFSISHAKGMFSLKITPTRTLGNEIASYVKAKTPSKGFVHSDENLDKYGIRDVVENIRRDYYNHNDLIVFVVGEEKLAESVRNVILWYFNSLQQNGLMNETRKVLESGDTEYMRPLPGAARMYPETDVRPLPLHEILNNIDREVRTPEEIKDELMQRFDNKELVDQFLSSKYFDMYLDDKDYFTKNRVSLLLNVVKDIERTLNVDVLSKFDYVKEAIALYEDGLISKEAFIYALENAFKKDVSPKDIVKNESLFKIDKQIIDKEIKEHGISNIKEAIAHFKKKYGMRVDVKDVVIAFKGG